MKKDDKKEINVCRFITNCRMLETIDKGAVSPRLPKPGNITIKLNLLYLLNSVLLIVVL